MYKREGDFYNLKTGEYLNSSRNENPFKNEIGFRDENGNFVVEHTTYCTDFNGEALSASEFVKEITGIDIDGIAIQQRQQEQQQEQQPSSIKSSQTVPNKTPQKDFGNLTTSGKSSSHSSSLSEITQVDNLSQTELESTIPSNNSEQSDITPETTIVDADSIYNQLVKKFQSAEHGGYDADDAQIFAGKFLQYIDKGFSEQDASDMSKEYAATYSKIMQNEELSAQQANKFMKIYNFNTAVYSKNKTFEKMFQ